LILLLVFVVRTSASDCLQDVFEMTSNVSSGTLNFAHTLCFQALQIISDVGDKLKLKCSRKPTALKFAHYAG